MKAATRLLLASLLLTSACDEDGAAGPDASDPSDLGLEVTVRPVRGAGCPLRLPVPDLDGGVSDAGVVVADAAAGERTRVAVAPDRRFEVVVTATNSASFAGLPRAEVATLGPTEASTSTRTVTLLPVDESATRLEATLLLQGGASELTVRVRALAMERLVPLKLEQVPTRLRVYPIQIDALDGGPADGGGDAGAPPADAGARLPASATVRFAAELSCLGHVDGAGLAGQPVTFATVPDASPSPAAATTDDRGVAHTWLRTPAAANFRVIARSGSLEATWPERSALAP